MEQLQAIKTQLEKTYFHWSARMREFPRSDMGLVPDHIRTTPKYKECKAACDRSFEQLRTFNYKLTNKQKRELARMRRSC